MNMTSPKSASTAALLNKVPDVTIGFWAIKIMSTTVGETGADYLAVNVGLGTAITDAVMVGLLLIALFIQLSTRRYVPAIYWLSVVLVSIVGTQITDALTDHLGVSLYVSTAVFSVALAVIFLVWYRIEKTLSVHTITSRRREVFYWSAILCTFALGTAAGDLATEALGLGFKVGVVAFGALIALTAAAYRFRLNAVVAFWVSYILTRPLGASLGDLLSQSRELGGLGLGTVWTSVIFLAVISALVGYLTFGRGSKGRESNTPGLRPWSGRRFALACSLPVLLLALSLGNAYVHRQAPPQTATKTTPLGDLSQFKVIVIDTRMLVEQGDLAGAKVRIKELETSWDEAEAGLKPRSPTDWHDIDSGIDRSLSALRANAPDASTCKAALDHLIVLLDRG